VSEVVGVRLSQQRVENRQPPPPQHRAHLFPWSYSTRPSISNSLVHLFLWYQYKCRSIFVVIGTNPAAWARLSACDSASRESRIANRHPRTARANTLLASACEGFRIQGAGFRVQGSWFRVRGSGFRVQGQTAFFRSWICAGARRNPAACGTNRGD
jgi:hypothetical protein